MIDIKPKIGVPKYKQIINSIEKAILSGTLKVGDQLPSINTIKNDHKLSRDTVLSAFNELKNRGVIKSVVGKGYYLTSDNIAIKQKVFLLFDELNSFKEDLYNSFIENLDTKIQVDIYFHHFNKTLFNKLINDNSGYYNYYVIMPANLKNTNQAIKNLPKESVYILDQIHPDLLKYPAIYQNFEKDIFNKLASITNLIKKYTTLVLIYNNARQPKGMLKGFNKFCKTNNIPYKVIESLNNKNIEQGELYIIPDDKNLLVIIKKIKNSQLTLAKNIGIISYNDTLLKEVIEDGITTISTDFNAMGKRLAEMLLNKEQNKIENPNHLIIRNSL